MAQDMTDNIFVVPFDVRRDEMCGYLSIGLEILANTQRGLHEISPPAQSESSFKKQTQDNFLAIQVELAELLQEMSWKPWDTSQPAISTFPQNQVIAEEFADVLAFLGHIMRILNDAYGISTNELAAAYRRKTEKNVSRFQKMQKGN
jgi:NTP pyrophosphatase (non-canonical NTP hydrolase)